MNAAVPEPEVAPSRGNDDWVRELQDAGEGGNRARRELRAVLVRGLRRVLASRGVAEDVCEDFAQEALVRVRDRIGSYRGESRFTTWAMAIATRIAFDELRHKRWKDVSFEAITADSGSGVTFEPAETSSPEKRMLRERVLSQLQRVIEHELTDRQRAVLQAELAGMPQAEIALQLGMNRNALYKLAHDARKKVKLHLEAAGVKDLDVLWVFE